MLRRKVLKKGAKKIERIYLSCGWNIQFQKRHNNGMHNNILIILIRGSLRKLYKYPVNLYKDLLNNLSCYLSCLHASVSSNISAFGRKYFAFQEGNIFAFQEANFVSAVKPMFSDVGDTNISATMFLTFDKGFSLKKNI